MPAYDELICNVPTPSEHCKTNCQHGHPHKKDECTKEEFCSLGAGGKIHRVKCIKITPKIMERWK